jgi:hypothetical protein
MTKLVWDEMGSRLYELGIDRGVFYQIDGPGFAWNGLTSVVETIADSTETVHFIDGTKFLNQLSLGDYSATLQAFTYPDEFSEYDGYTGQALTYQQRREFNLSYRSLVGNDVSGSDHAYKLHLVYNCLASPTQTEHATVGSSQTPTNFSWNITTTPIAIPNARPTAHIVIDTTRAYSGIVSIIEDILYGTAETSPRFPTIEEIIDIFADNSPFIIIDHGDGSFTAISPEDSPLAHATLVEPTVFELKSPSVNLISADTYTAYTL